MTLRVSATGITPFGKRTENLPTLLEIVGRQALEGAGRRAVDGLFVGSMVAGSLGATENLVAQMADRLGIDPAFGARVDAASASGAAAFHTAAAAVSSGQVRRALVLAGEKMTGSPTPEVAASLARSLAPSEVAVGATMPGLAALIAQRYAARYGADLEVFDEVAATFRSQAARNPNAMFRATVTPAEVRSGRAVALPLRLHHCSANADGGAAALLESDHGDVEVAGLGQGVDALALSDRLEVTGFRATRMAAQRAYEAARTTRKSVQVAELHDAFAPFALIDLEDLGFCGPGGASEFWRAGHGTADGMVPLNPSGGLLGRGHPVGASGLAGIVEVVRQLEGTAGATAIPARPHAGLAQSIGGLGSHVLVTLLRREGSV